MIKVKMNAIIILLAAGSLVGCDDLPQQFQAFKEKAEKVNNYEAVSLTLAKEVRFLKAEINQLQFKIKTLEAQNNYLRIKLKKKGERKIAAFKPAQDVKNDMVKFEIYKWSPSQLLGIGETSFLSKDYEKSAQYFRTLISKYPKSDLISDKTLFQAGVSSYKTNRHYDWSLDYLTRLTLNYPTSPYYRGAKLWLGLSHYKKGNHDKFFKIVEEFRKKYKNTKEWEILRAHYEEFRREHHKVKQNAKT